MISVIKAVLTFSAVSTLHMVLSNMSLPEGCVRIPETSYTIQYPDGVNRTDEMLSPVAPTDKYILLECAPGYVQVIHSRNPYAL